MARVPELDTDCKGQGNDVQDTDFAYKNGYELFEDYKAMLDDCYPMVNICGFEYSPAKTWQEVDPIAFSCGFFDWANGLLADGEVNEALIDDASIYLPK
jgi:hypothetical protein